jgi:hypothetical protein
VVCAALFFAVVAAPPSASAAPVWVHWDGRYFTCWIPNDHWQVVESSNTLEISSPTGLATVSFGYATNGPAPYSLTGVRKLLLSPEAGLKSVRLLSQGRTFATGGGGVGQVTKFLALRIRDRATVRGVLTAEVFNNRPYGPYGFAGYLRLAPASQWNQWSQTLAVSQKRIVNLGRG